MNTIFLYERAAQILLYLVNTNNPLTIFELQNLVMASNRTVRYDLDNIDEFLVSKNINKLSRKPRVGIAFVGNKKDREKIKSLLKDSKEYEYVFSPNERRDIIIINFIDAEDYITTEDLAQELGVSQSTVNNDLKRVREIIGRFNLKIVFRQRYGLILQGEEKDKRKLLVELWLKYVYNSSSVKDSSYRKDNQFKFKNLINRLKNHIDIPFVENIVNIMEKKIALNYSDVAYANIVVHICVALNRIKKQRYINLDIKDKDKLKNTMEFIVAKDLVKILEDYYKVKISEDEIIYITTCLLGGNLDGLHENSRGEWIHIQLLVKELIEEVNSKIIMDISQDWELFNSLLEHMRPMMNRIKYGINLENPILKNIKTDYAELFKIVKESIHPIEKFLGKSINHDEIGYLTIHFGAAIERERHSGIIKPKVAIVCDTGLGTSELLSVQIQSMFHVDIVATISKRRLQSLLETEDIDIIISTIPIDGDISTKIIYVEPILTQSNIKELNNIFLKTRDQRMEIDGLINIIERSCTINNRQQLERDLHNIFNMRLIKNIDKDDKPVLKDVITKETIKLNVDVKSWEEAVKIGGSLLVDANAVKEEYVDAMINTVKEIGPYIVIAEGIAMPHARPENGVLKVGMSLITLKNPIDFGSEENDPVKLVVSFCAIDSETHLKALSQLMVLLEDKTAVNKILKANNIDEVIDIIYKFSNKY